MIFLGLVLSACDKTSDTGGSNVVAQPFAPPDSTMPRWYTQGQVNRGYNLFQQNCAVCHKADASGTTNWQQTDANGKLPPPPLNGTAHTWHHSLNVLRRAVREGGIPLGGSMPGFKDRLNAGEIDDILAWVMSHWNDKIYGIWQQRNDQSTNRS